MNVEVVVNCCEQGQDQQQQQQQNKTTTTTTNKNKQTGGHIESRFNMALTRQIDPNLVEPA